MFLKKLREGKCLTDVFDYDGEEITFRAVTSAEFDEAKYMSLEGVDDKLAGYILKVRLGMLDDKKIDPDKLKEKDVLMRNYIKYMLEFDYWVVYHAMKDFQPRDFSFSDVKKMRYVHDLAQKAIHMSSENLRIVKSFVYTEEGKRLASLVFKYHQPLVNSALDVTPLQYSFLKESNPDKPAEVKDLNELGRLLPYIGRALKDAR